MQGSRRSMRPNSSHLGEITIKVPAPFAGVSDLGFTAQYRAQHFNEPQRDVPLVFEGPSPPVERLAEVLRLLTGEHSRAYAWSHPIVLGDGVVVFTFLHDCAAIAHLRLSDVIEMRVSDQRSAVADFSLPLADIVRPNGERLLWGLAS